MMIIFCGHNWSSVPKASLKDSKRPVILNNNFTGGASCKGSFLRTMGSRFIHATSPE
jgi:hypothetical protein